MKKTFVTRIAVVGFICGCAALLSVGPVALAAEKTAGGGDAKLIVNRSPKLGSGSVISVSIDGKKVKSFGSGNFSGSLPAGKHTLTVAFDPARGGEKPANLEITAVAGQTYGFTATIAHGDLVLAKSK